MNTTYTDYQSITRTDARRLTGDWTARRVFHDDLGGGSESIECYALADGRHVVACTGTGDWLIPAGVDACETCEREASNCYTAAGFDNPYA